MDPLRGPTPLQKLLKLYDANTCHCLGCSFPAHEGCRIKIDSDNDSFRLALADLRNLLSVKWEDHGPGLIDVLKSIAHAFSCSKHQQSSGHISQFTYYWLSGQLPGLPKPKKRYQSYDPAVFNDQNSQTAAGITLQSTSGHSALLGQQLQISSPPESTVPLRAGDPRGDRIAEEIEIETGHHPSNLSSGAFETFSENLSVLDDTGELIDQQEIVSTPPEFPNFQPLEGPGPKSAKVIAHSIFNVMQKPLSDKKELDKGRIYTLRMLSHPGYVKIGRTENTILKRKKQIDACFPYGLEIINEDDHCKTPNHTRIEALVHAELQNYRRYFKCPCKRKHRGKLHDCEGNDGMTQHGEWFEIDEDKACEVVSRWRKWMSLDPYSDGNLRPTEQARVDRYSEDPKLMNDMTVKDEKGKEHWNWDKYMDSPQWSLHSLWIYKTLFGPRFDKSNCSRWDSLWKHWKSNNSSPENEQSQGPSTNNGLVIKRPPRNVLQKSLLYHYEIITERRITLEKDLPAAGRPLLPCEHTGTSS
ncbi:hypothetical protein OEA41_009139 [Lepraria neglecta]|uniref:Bacteriophage T5 Orf172 DNA-binding domain-containing protein n=1 Tax=Lepraria neglecta TaxID=209136 RepID=A0AAD9Z1V0_9LECA|nr:hypothetical protein OEA41_009139 [Lepraria neglecta]